MINFTFPDKNMFPLYGKAKAVVAELRPGDLLYLPPMWFHHVIARSFSLSVNVWSNAYEGDIVDLLNNHSYPKHLQPTVDNTVDDNYRPIIKMLVYYIRSLVRSALELPDDSSANKFILKSLIENRYKPFQTDFSCSQEQFDIRKCPQAGFLTPEQEGSVASYIEKGVALFGELRAVQPQAIEIVLLDYLERLGFLGVSVSHACSFLRCVAEGAFQPNVRERPKGAAGPAAPTMAVGDQAM